MGITGSRFHVILRTPSACKCWEHYDDCDDVYDTGGYSHSSKHVRCRMARYKANSDSKDHTPGEIVREIED